jgi:23S rRNA (uracil-5-)-methyltransferase RumA
MREPLCRYFGKCGGCSAQHVEYDAQLSNKAKALAHAVRKDDIKTFRGAEFSYRNRMDFIFHERGLGLRQKSQWDRIVDVEECVISNGALNKILSEIREFSKDADCFDIKKHSGTFRYAVIRTPQNDSSVSFVLNSRSTRLKEAVEKIKFFAKESSARNVIVTYVPPETEVSVSEDFFVVKGSEFLKENLLGYDFLYSVQGFFQNNHEITEKMQLYCNELLKSHNTRAASLLDLYAGVGAFGIINAGLFKDIVMIESVRQSVDAAGKNIDSNKVKNAKVICLDCRYLKRIEMNKPVFVITDPPRSGMHPDTVSALNKMSPEAIIYVSCNVEQLRKDIPKFKEYLVRSAALFDFFPQTPHCEAVVELKKP